MAEPLNPAQEAGKQLIGGKHSQKLSTVKAGLKVDDTEAKKITSTFKDVKKSVADTRKEFQGLTEDANKAAGAIARTSGTGGTAANPNAIIPGYKNTSQTAPTKKQATGGSGGGGTDGPGGKGAPDDPINPFEGIAGSGINRMIGAGIVGGQLMGALDSRIERGKVYASSADKLNVLTQQMTGMSQGQVMNDLRRPLANYRLGSGGINALHNFQNQTGYAASPQLARSIEGLHTMSGYTKDAGAILQDQMALMNPATSNRMFNMTGISAVGFGGGMNDPQQMRMDLAKRFGMTNPDIARASLAPGSRTRAIMSDSGIPQELQEDIIQMGMAQSTYKRKGGSGDYDPSNKNHRELVGIEGNLSTQEQETSRLREQREENFARLQLDSMASAEKVAQTQVAILANIESMLSGLVGARTATAGWQRWAGRALQVGGIAAMAIPGAGTLAGAGAFAVGTAMAGDPPDSAPSSGPGSPGGVGSSSSANDSNIMVPNGYGGGRAPLSEVSQRSDFKKLKPQMQERLKSMMRENPNVGVGGGYRDPEAQRRMFLDRHVETTKGNHDRVWNGKYWKLVKGAPAAPPGSCLAGDSLVLTREGWVPIESVQVGDEVWTHQGRWRSVVQHTTFVKDVVEIKATGQLPIVATPDHRWFVAPDPMFRKKLSKGGEWDGEVLPMKLCYSEDLEGNLLLSPARAAFEGMDMVSPEWATPEMLRFAGFWVADGSYRVEKGGQISGFLYAHDDEASLVEQWAVEAGVDLKRQKKLDNSVQRYYFKGADWLVSEFGRRSTERYIPTWLLANAADLGGSFLEGYLQGDGHYNEGVGNRAPTWNLHAVNRPLVLGVRMLAQALGFRTTGQRGVSQRTSVIAEGNGRQSGTVVHSDKESFAGAIALEDSVRDRLWEYFDWWAARAKVTPVQGTMIVHDIAVDEDESFYVNGVLSHNSMHEIGMAADLVGDLDWMNANANRFGLKHFAGVNGEPWHVQPVEFPNSRREYESGGAEWGTDAYDGGGDNSPGDGTTSGMIVTDNSGDGHAAMGMSGGPAHYQGMSISEIVDTYVNSGFTGSQGSSPRSTGASASGGTVSGGGSVSLSGASGATMAARAAYNAGFRGDDLVTAVAIAGRESGWRNVKSKVSNDWGMWQINGVHKSMLEGMGFDNLMQDMLDPQNNARAAFKLYQSQGFDPWRASGNSSRADVQAATGGRGFDPNGSPTWNTEQHQPAAQAAVDSLNTSGDPMHHSNIATGQAGPMATGGSTYASGAPVTVHSAPTIHVNPTIQFHGTPQSQDLKSIAKELTAMMEDSARQLEMRSA